MVTLHKANEKELRNFYCFMTGLHQRFEDPLAERKVRDCIKTMCQGCRVVAEYTEEFHELACRLEDILISCFKDGLNDNLYNAYVLRGGPAMHHDWYVLAEEVELDQERNQYHSTQLQKKPAPGKREAVKLQNMQLCSIACFKCGQVGRVQGQSPSQEEPLLGASGKPARPHNRPGKQC